MSAEQDHPSHQRLAAFLWGQLSDTEHAAVESHIGKCATCCQVLREIPEDTLVVRLRGADKPGDQAPPVPTARVHQIPRELREHPRYKIERFLGAGGMGLVYQAQHRVMERPVALKIIHRDLFRNKAAIERFRYEVKAAARLAHPNIVTAYDAEQAGETHFLVMEFVDGINLARLVARRGSLGVAHACNYVRQAALGLQHAFENGMVHRDIKPHNLMLTRKGQIKILDFGLARLTGDPGGAEPAVERDKPGMTSAGQIMGTPDYMAPEQCQDSRKADIRSDIYSLGCTLYFLLVGHAPFTEGSSSTKVYSHRYFEAQPVAELREDLPGEVGEIVKKMMAKDPAARYQTPAELAKALTPFARPGPAASIEAQPVKEADAAPAADTPRPTEPTRAPRAEKAGKFLSRCPYCPARVRLSTKALGASVRCPQCTNFFTAVPENDGSVTPRPEGATHREIATTAPALSAELVDSPARSSAPASAPPPERMSPMYLAAIASLAGLAIYFLFVSAPLALVLILVTVVLLTVGKPRQG